MQIHLVLFFILFIVFKTTSATTTDSIGTENNNGKKTILHKIEAKETYYSLGRKYKVSPQEIIKFNNNASLQIGTVVKVPTERTFSEPGTLKVATTTPAEKESYIDFKIGPKETLFAIAKRFNTTVEEIKQINNLKGNALSIGQILKIRTKSQTNEPSVKETAKTETVKPPVIIVPVTVDTPHETHIPDQTSSEHLHKIPSNKYGLREVNERGIAVWIADENVDHTKMLVLHRTAPVGTVIKVTNPMTERSTFAKVVGLFTENETTKDVIIVVTKAAADLLGALDKRFQVNLVYGVPNIPNE